MKKFANKGLVFALISAFLYAFNVIIEKKYITYISSESILFLMYIGSGVGLLIIHLLTQKKEKSNSNKITKNEVPAIITIVLCELLASLLIIEAVKIVAASVVSLLSIFEIILTAICAYFFFKEPVKRNDLIAIFLVVLGCVILNFRSGVLSNLKLSSLLVIGGCLCWGIENNVTAMISSKEPAFFTSIKCSSVAIFYFILALLNHSLSFSYPILIVFGFFTYGLSILSYALSTRHLGANKTTLIFSFSPIFGVILSILIYHEKLTSTFIISMLIMISAILLINRDVKDS